MNAHALLTSQGWRGHGHTLHATDDSTGLAKPILVSRKDNKLGVGKKEHATADQWWLNAFDQQLKGLDTSKQGVVVQTVTNGRLNAIATAGTGKYKGWASLYTSFVSGGLLEGTIKVKESPSGSSSSSSSIGSGTETTATPEAEDGAPAVKKESREERRARKQARRERKAGRAARRIGRAARRATKAEAKPAKGEESVVETKAERRARREDRRRRKEEKRRSKGGTG